MKVFGYEVGKRKAASAATRLNAKKIPTIEELRGRSYAIFMDSGVRVDLDRYFATEAGQRALQRVSDSAVGRTRRKVASD